MENHYKTLGVNTSATADEIRRAYRILARRYHPDVNPGKDSEDKFKIISQAYSVLSDAEARRKYDAEFDPLSRERISKQFEAYERMRRAASGARTSEKPTENSEAAKAAETRPAPQVEADWLDFIWAKLKGLPKFLKRPLQWSKAPSTGVRFSVIEVSVTLREALFGTKKTVEITEPEGIRKVSVRIPSGVRNGSVVRLRATGKIPEELVLIVRVPSHPQLSIQNKGVVIEIPITVSEAFRGTNITVPTLEDQMVIKIPPNTQSGHEIRLKERGVTFKNGSRGDLIVRLMIQIPEAQGAVGLSDKMGELEKYYDSSPRQALPKSLLEY